MPSPFPGMNPDLEQPVAWQDFHNTYAQHIREKLLGHEVYDAAGYEDYVYGSLPEPLLPVEDGPWAEQRLTSVAH